MIKLVHLVFLVTIGIANFVLAMDPAPAEINDASSKNSVEYNKSHVCVECISVIRNVLMDDASFLVDCQIENAAKYRKYPCKKEECLSKQICLDMSDYFNGILVKDSDLLEHEILPLVSAIGKFRKEIEDNMPYLARFLSKGEDRVIRDMSRDILHFCNKYNNFAEGLKREYVICACNILISKQKIQPPKKPHLIIFEQAFANFQAECYMVFQVLYHLKSYFKIHFSAPVENSELVKVTRKVKSSSEDNIDDALKGFNKKKEVDFRYDYSEVVAKLDLFLHGVNYRAKNNMIMRQTAFDYDDINKAKDLIKAMSEFVIRYYKIQRICPDGGVLPSTNGSR